MAIFGFNDKHEHSVVPSLDYPFASEFYRKDDCRYCLVQEFIRLIWATKQVQVYNCKIEIINTDSGFFNVYVYTKEIEKIFEKEYDSLTTLTKNKDYTDLFFEAMKKCPIRQLHGKKINPNGVFIIDFIICAKSYVLNQALNPLSEVLKKQYPLIQYITTWDTTLYIFFSEEEAIRSFQDNMNAYQMKRLAYEVITEFDNDGVWQLDNLSIMLDFYDNYSSLGGRNYFNSDAMFNGLYL